MIDLGPAQQYEALKEGVREAVADALANALAGVDGAEILGAIKEGVRLAFDQLYASQIQDAIQWGVEEALDNT